MRLSVAGGLMDDVPAVVDSLRRYARPPSPLAGRLSVQSLLFAVGDGTFITVGAVFFTQIVGLSAAQVGVGITVAGVVSMIVAVPAGKLADRIGPQRMWALGALGTASMYAVWPFIEGFAAFLVMSVVIEVVNSSGGAGRGAYVLDILPQAERVSSQAYMYSVLNLGFTLGASLGGLALLFDDDVVRALPWLVAVLALVNAYWITRLPAAPHRSGPPVEEPPDAASAEVPDAVAVELAVEGAVEDAAGERVVPGALRNRGFLSASFFGGVLNTNQVLLQIVIPLWLVEETDAPRVLLAWLFGTNTVMCIFLPMLASRGVRDVPTALRAARISSVFFVVSCLITLITHDTLGWTTILLVWAGHVTVTGAELYLSAASWALEAGLSDPDKRGEYQGAGNLGSSLGYVWAPAAYTFLAMEWGAEGWLVIAGIVVLATVGLHPAARAGQRFLDRYDLDPTR
ncbi:MFS transporter [Nocardioides sp. R-C-SC26]|uniref:MFS transporter n=1 Tax=Nocardioides sp. R-C-SC26 TaxID=2870414 RepID=UPI001E5BC957|nr:MFS transporter [Nocardioides sp. R-C-SC26]